jgi:cytidine deaminase
MTTDQDLFHAARSLLQDRFGDTPWSGAAAVRLADGTILTSTAPDAVNPAVELCHETGALCEAFKLDADVRESICVVQPEPGSFQVLAPCGVCQERLFLYGPTVRVGVPSPHGGWRFVSLTEVQPHYWRTSLADL